MRTANEIQVDSHKDYVHSDEEGVYITITPEKCMDETFFLPWPIATKLAEDIQAERMDADFTEKDIDNIENYHERS